MLEVAMRVLVAAAAAAFASVLLVIAALIGTAETTRTMQREAVAHGCAEWVIDPATGESAWRWKEGE